MRSSISKWLGVLGTVALLSLSSSVFAATLQSDDFSSTLGSFWKVKQVTQPANATFPAPSYKVENGKLSLTSADNDIYQGTWEPYYAYQDGITGDFTCQVKILSSPQLDGWSNTGLMIVQSPVPDTIVDGPTDIPSWFLTGASRDHGTEFKGGGQALGDSNTLNASLQPPYWLRMDKKGMVVTTFTSFDGGKTWNQVTERDLSDSAANANAAPIADPVAIGIFQQTHSGTTLGTSVVSNFEVGTLDQGGKLPGDTVLPAAVTGSVKDNAGAVLPATTIITITEAGGATFSTGVDANGNYTTYLPPGTYTFTADRNTFDNSASKPVTVTAGQSLTLDLVFTPLPGINLGTASTDTTVTAKVLADPTDATVINSTDLGPINPTFDDSKWTDVNMPEDIATTDGLVAANSYFWYRVGFTIPASFQTNKGKVLNLSGFNVDDGDWTFLNGHLLGQTVNNWSVIRSYPVDPDYINWTGTNVVSILGQQGGGGAGNGTATDVMKLLTGDSSFGSVFGHVVTKTGTAVGGITLTLTDGKGGTWASTSNSFDGGYRFSGLLPGSYTLTPSGPLTTPVAPSAVTVTATQSTVIPDISVAGNGWGPADLAAVDVSKLKETDIGASGDKGTLKVTGTQVQLTAGGADIYGNADDMSWASSPTPVSGDFTAVVQARPTAGVADWAKAGIMARVDNTPGSPNVMALNSFFYGPNLQWRTAQDGATSGTGPQDIPQSWIMLTRSGDTFSMYRANSDATNAVLIGTQTLAGFPKSLTLGLAATSHTAATLGTANFDNFKLSSTAFVPGGSVPPTVKGDLNGDGKVNIADATMALQFAVGNGTPTAAQIAAGDVVGGDGKIGIPDVTKILQAAIGAIQL